MEIGSMGGYSMSMGGMEGMRGMRRPPGGGDPSEMADKMSARIMEQQDADEDGLLSVSELSAQGSGDSDILAKIDTDGDGLLSQNELKAGIQSTLEQGKAALENGSMPSGETREFMQQMRDLAGDPPPGMRSKGAQAYGMMQQGMFGGSMQATAYNTDHLLMEALDMAV